MLRFYLAMIAYAILAVLATVTLQGPFRLATWVFLGGLAFKTWLVTLRRDDQDE